MLLTIDVAGRSLQPLANLLKAGSSTLNSLELSGGNFHHWALRPSTEQIQIRCILEYDGLKAIPADQPLTNGGGLLSKYVNERAFTAHTLWATALIKAFQPLLDQANDHNWLSKAYPFACQLPPLLGSPEVFETLWGKIGYTCETTALDAPQMYLLRLTGTFSLPRLLWDLIMVLPALDLDRYYWTPTDDMNFILGRLGEYSAQHPVPAGLEKAYQINYDRIFNPLAKNLARFSDPTLEREAEDQLGLEIENSGWNPDEAWQVIHASLQDLEVSKLLVHHTGSAALLTHLLPDSQFSSIMALDTSMSRLQTAGNLLGRMNLPAERKATISLTTGSPWFKDVRLAEYDAMVLPERFCELPPHALEGLEQNLFASGLKGIMFLVPNAEFNAKLSPLTEKGFRHPRHQFEWNRLELRQWAEGMADRTSHQVHFIPTGPKDQAYGSPATLVLFTPFA